MKEVITEYANTFENVFEAAEAPDRPTEVTFHTQRRLLPAILPFLFPLTLFSIFPFFNGWLKQVPDHLCCPITMDILRDPVITPAGITYERSVLLQHLKRVRFSHCGL